jgi:hypothetical protein
MLYLALDSNKIKKENFEKMNNLRIDTSKLLSIRIKTI